jgi:hypothetical protein
MAEAITRPNEPTEADLRRALCGLTRETLGLAATLMGALEAGREHFPPQAKPILDDLSVRFARQRASTEAMLEKVAA